MALDDFGLWFVYKGPLPDDCPAGIKIPGTHVRFVGEKGIDYVFDLYAEPPVRMAVRGEFGQVLAERSRS